MDQTHIGYTGWQEPRVNAMPEVTEIQVAEPAKMGVAPADLQFDAFNQPRHCLEVFNGGRAPFEFSAAATAPWIALSDARGTVRKDTCLWVSVDWTKAPIGAAQGSVRISGAGADPVTFRVTSFHPPEVTRETLRGFVEADGYVSMEAAHYTKKSDAGAVHWEEIPGLGRTLSAMTILPCTAASVTPPHGSPSLEYRMYLFDPGRVQVQTIISPSLNFVPGRGLRFALAFDDQPPRIVDALEHNTLQDLEKSVRDSVRTVVSSHSLTGSGYHTLKYWLVDPAIVLQKIVVDLGGLKPSYLGPPESWRH